MIVTVPLLPRCLLLISLFVIVLNFVSRGKEEHFALEVMLLHVYSQYIMVIKVLAI
jgi:hypothetical protein